MTAPAAFAAGGATCWRACRSTASCPTATRSWSNWPGRHRPPGPHRRGADYVRRAAGGPVEDVGPGHRRIGAFAVETGGPAAPHEVMYLCAVPKPSISAFFPCYNDANTIGDLVTQADGVLRRLTDDYEIIVVNDGSRDESAAVLSSLRAQVDSRCVWCTHETNRGYGAALRSGFEHATKELVFYTDGDGQYDVGGDSDPADAADRRHALRERHEDDASGSDAPHLHRQPAPLRDPLVVLAPDHRRGLRLPADSALDPRRRSDSTATAARSASSW